MMDMDKLPVPVPVLEIQECKRNALPACTDDRMETEMSSLVTIAASSAEARDFPTGSDDAHALPCLRENDNQQWHTSASHKRVFSCLYTKQKLRKRKIWNDGRLVIISQRAILYDANPSLGTVDPELDSCTLSKEQCRRIIHNVNEKENHEMIETETFLITIECVWKNENMLQRETKVPLQCNRTHLPVLSKHNKHNPSVGLKKIMTNKFRIPGNYIPPPPDSTTAESSFMCTKRKQPLQPGELVQRLYGASTTTRTAIFGSHLSSVRHEDEHPQQYYTSHCNNHDVDRQKTESIIHSHSNFYQQHFQSILPTHRQPSESSCKENDVKSMAHVEQKERNCNRFAIENGFDPDCFYGEDNEHEDADDEGGNFIACNFPDQAIKRFRIHDQTLQNGSVGQYNHGNIVSQQDACSLHSSSESCAKEFHTMRHDKHCSLISTTHVDRTGNSPLSTNELLNLFGEQTVFQQVDQPLVQTDRIDTQSQPQGSETADMFCFTLDNDSSTDESSTNG
jgi:hypothetical protein